MASSSLGWATYPCRYTNDPAFHVWRTTAVPGWFVCQGCGVVGCCTPCFAEDGLTMNRAAVPMLCPVHQELANASPLSCPSGEGEQS